MAGFTPLIKKIKNGTFIVFASSGEDLNLSFDSSSKRFRFSKFALLDIPDIENGSNFHNTIQLRNIEGAFNAGGSTATPFPASDRIDLSESLQNYLFNMETIIINDPTYNRNEYQTVSERIFNKWLKEIGALRFLNANVGQTNITPRYQEELDNDNVVSGDLYNRVYKHIGIIDITGANFASNRNAFKEIYTYIPTQAGKTPTILFKTFQDTNYFPSKTIKADPATEYIEGQGSSTPITAAGLRTLAFYDMDVPLGTLSYIVNGSGANPIWFAPLASNGPNAYFTDVSFTDVSNDEIIRTNTFTSQTISYKRSRLDGIEVDFDVASYKEIDGAIIKNFSDFNNSGSSDDFKFNAIALYYDLYDPSNNQVFATNLFGVCLLNDVVAVSAGTSRIEELLKIKQNNALRNQGNGFGFKFNFKFDPTGSESDIDIQVSVNDYNTFSMQLFSTAIQKILDLNSKYENALIDIMSLKNEIANLDSYINSLPNPADLKQQFDDAITNAQLVTSYQNLVDLIKANSDKINQILQGQTTVGLDFTLDLRAYDGLDLKLTNNILEFRNNRQAYSAAQEVKLYTGPNDLVTKNNVFKIDTFNTIIYHTNGGVKLTADDNIYIYLDDKNTNDNDFGFRNFQLVTLVLVDEIDFQGTYGIVFYTDSQNKFNQPSAYSKIIGTVPNSKLKSKIDILCVDNTTYKFIVY